MSFLFGIGGKVLAGLALAAASLAFVLRMYSQIKKAGRDEVLAQIGAEQARKATIANRARSTADDSYLLPPGQRTH